MNILKCKLYPSPSSSSLISSLFLHPPDPWPTWFLSPQKHSVSLFPLISSCYSSSSSSSSSKLSQSTSPLGAISQSPFTSVIKSKPTTLFSAHQKSLFTREGQPSSFLQYSSYGSDERDSDSEDEERIDFTGDDPEGPDYPNFANQYRLRTDTLKQELTRIKKLDKLFELAYQNMDYLGRINAGVFLSRLSHLTDPRNRPERKLARDEIEFLTKLTLVNINVLPDANLISLVTIILSQKLSDTDNLTITTLQEIRRRLKDFGVHHLVWLWKQSGYKIRFSDKAKEWSKLREEIINVVERRVNNFSYDFQNVTEISQLSRILLYKTSSAPYLHRLIKNITIFTESIDYGLAWALLSQFTGSTRRYERIDSNDLAAIYDKCYNVIQQKLYESNFKIDNYVKDFFLQRVVESPENVKFSFNEAFFKTLARLVKVNQKQITPSVFLKALYFFGDNQYYPTDLLNSLCVWIEKHPDEYINDPELRPNILFKLFSECRYFESRPDQWEKLGNLLLDPVKISTLNQEEKFRLLSYLIIMGNYSHINKFCPEFDELCEKSKLQRHFWRAFHHIYAGLSKPLAPIAIEGQLIKQSLEKYNKKARRTFHFIDKTIPENDFDEMMTTALGNKCYFSKRVWTQINVVLNYVVAWDKQGNLFKFDSRAKNNVSLIDELITDLDNYHIAVIFPIDESHYCYEPPIIRGQFLFKLEMIKRLGFTPIMIDRRNWKDLNDKQKVSLIKREIGKVKTIYFGESN